MGDLIIILVQQIFENSQNLEKQNKIEFLQEIDNLLSQENIRINEIKQENSQSDIYNVNKHQNESKTQQYKGQLLDIIPQYFEQVFQLNFLKNKNSVLVVGQEVKQITLQESQNQDQNDLEQQKKQNEKAENQIADNDKILLNKKKESKKNSVSYLDEHYSSDYDSEDLSRDNLNLNQKKNSNDSEEMSFNKHIE
ncbi:hypothetical protein PPERSA_09809 [Pseudocohnilembus persalinus]|uniref:Uncharacterized protein n=1 Tax=Pseudocohnilembus persalinus TaxID=266149 RepID=A0A0V0QUY3_PSEPJ|nr:hypothetical protein PPERSA_09809 [Pseudocohnilembus persalinus]|eukprot:KRX05669.1 hypothetical protein PPERSA_09809 [Pseudocohnilembus persalinus]